MKYKSTLLIVILCVIGVVCGQQVCPTIGFFSDRYDCAKYIYCTGAGAAPISLNCDDGLYFDSNQQICMNKDLVVCAVI